MCPAGAAWSSPASFSMSSTAGSSRMGCGFPSTSRPPRAPPSAAWWATIPAARARCATATRARTCCRSTRCSPTERWRISARLRLISPTLRPLRRSCRSRAISLCSRRARPTIETVVRGDPEAILFVEFAEDDQYHNLRRLMQLKDVIGALGLGWDKLGAKWGGVVEIFDPKLQAAIGETRTAGLNIMMSMKEEGKPVSFVEDCAVPLEHLA